MGRSTSRRWARLVQQVLMEENWLCHLCRDPSRPADSGDHLIPVSVAPELEFERWNVRAAHMDPCNRRRGTRPIPAAVTLKTSREW